MVVCRFEFLYIFLPLDSLKSLLKERFFILVFCLHPHKHFPSSPFADPLCIALHLTAQYLHHHVSVQARATWASLRGRPRKAGLPTQRAQPICQREYHLNCFTTVYWHSQTKDGTFFDYFHTDNERVNDLRKEAFHTAARAKIADTLREEYGIHEYYLSDVKVPQPV